MEVRKTFSWRKVFLNAYLAGFLVFLLGGLMPAEVSARDEAIGFLEIPKIGLMEKVVMAEQKGEELIVPDVAVGSYSRAKNKELLVGHSSTVFERLNDLGEEDLIMYGGRRYIVREIEIFQKDEIEMRKLLKTEVKDTLVLMTCAGEDLGGGDATHRLIVTAVEQ